MTARDINVNTVNVMAAGPDLDAWVAEKVMGWTRGAIAWSGGSEPIVTVEGWHDELGHHHFVRTVGTSLPRWSASTQMDAAMEVLDRLPFLCKRLQ